MATRFKDFLQTESFGSFFGGKVKPNDSKDKKMPMAQQKAMIAAQNAKNNKKQPVPDKHGSRRADDFDFALNGGKSQYTYGGKPAVTESKRDIEIHDLTHIHEPHESHAYDETQTNDKIKDGDVLHLGGNKTAVMVQAWPVEVTGNHSKESGFHTLKAGKSWDDFEDGKYKASAEKAKELASKFEEEGIEALMKRYEV